MVVVVQLLSPARFSESPWAVACHAFLSFTISQSLLKFTSIESVTLSNHLILCRPLLILPSIFPSNRVFFNEPALHSRWPKYWSFSFRISPSNEYSGFIFFRIQYMDSTLNLIKGPATLEEQSQLGSITLENMVCILPHEWDQLHKQRHLKTQSKRSAQ